MNQYFATSYFLPEFISVSELYSKFKKIIADKFCLTAVVIFAGFLSGCAGTGGSHELVGQPMSSMEANKFSDLQITVKTEGNVTLSQLDTERMKNLITREIQTDETSRFKSINATTPGTATLEAQVVIKNYDEGSAFARFMLAGLGQIHIDADVLLNNLSTKQKLAQYSVSKTFAWGGLYGASTDIKDVEVGFCKAVADSILQKE